MNKGTRNPNRTQFTRILTKDAVARLAGMKVQNGGSATIVTINRRTLARLSFLIRFGGAARATPFRIAEKKGVSRMSAGTPWRLNECVVCTSRTTLV
jgi:hypothetical protein